MKTVSTEQPVPSMIHQTNTNLVIHKTLLVYRQVGYLATSKHEASNNVSRVPATVFSVASAQLGD